MMFSEWAERHYGSEDLALVDCVASIEAAAGDDFAQLSADTKAKAVQLFISWIAEHHPDGPATGALAGEFFDGLLSGQG
ncbi:hypothetical protein [Streptacidiphilus fuscans]|uniref:Uncharacterized protein n=1 Tax=Streptacidiphilus fuscans TaxID=2789292 RepID=A0A931AWB1_9ACTN|nr:hypothetical protein [Streptacidiphilus fuscans]MBF9066659.1 hypothetical protein [Streptacidiphilus fuscans]